jgi:hypothetical protein
MLRAQTRILASNAAVCDVDGLTREGAQHDRVPDKRAAAGVQRAIDLEHLSWLRSEASGKQWLRDRWLTHPGFHIGRRATRCGFRGAFILDLSAWMYSVRVWH